MRALLVWHNFHLSLLISIPLFHPLVLPTWLVHESEFLTPEGTIKSVGCYYPNFLNAYK